MPDKPVTSVSLTWESGFRFTARDSEGHQITVDAPKHDGDGYEGMKPGGLLLSALAGCSGIDVVNILERQRQQVTGIEINVNGKQQPEAPWVMDEIELDYVITGKDLSEKSVQRAIKLSEEKYCFVGATLGGRSKITSRYRIIDEA
jgi:putative redox protein